MDLRHFTRIPDSGVSVGIFHSSFYLQKVVFENGGGTLIKRNAYFGDGHGILIGENSQIGLNAVLSTDVTLGDNVVRDQMLSFTPIRMNMQM